MNDDDETEIRIRLPLPLEVAGALTSAIGHMWPTSTIRPASHELVIAISRKRPKRVAQKTLRELLPAAVEPDADPEGFLERWAGDGLVISADAQSEAMQGLATWALVVLTSQAAPNFVEQSVSAVEPDGTKRRIVLTASWSKGQTPYARLKEAEAKIARLTIELESARRTDAERTNHD